VKYNEACEKDSKATLIWQAQERTTVLIFFYCAPQEYPETFSCFYHIPFIGRTIEPGCRTVYESVKGTGEIMELKGTFGLHELRTMSSMPDLEMYIAAENCWKQQLEAVKDVENASLTISFQPIASQAIRACDAKGGNPTGLKPLNHQWFVIEASWTNLSDEPLMHAACCKVVEVADAVSKKNNTFIPYRYTNYAAYDQNPLASYGAENLQKLRDVASRYDKDQVFQKLQHGGWLLSKA